MSRIQHADPKARRAAIWILALATVSGFCIILVFEYHKQDLQIFLEQNLQYLARHPLVIALVTLFFLLPVLVAGFYLLMLGNRIVESRRFPPPKYSVVRDTPVLEGVAGIRRGRVIQFIAILVLSGAAAVPVVFWMIFRAMARSF